LTNVTELGLAVEYRSLLNLRNVFTFTRVKFLSFIATSYSVKTAKDIVIIFHDHIAP